MFAKEMLIKTNIKTMTIVYKVTEMKICLRKEVCASKINM